MQKTIMHIIPTLTRAGAEMSLLRLLTVLKDRGDHHCVVVMQPHGPVSESLQAIGIEVVSLNMRGLGSLLSGRAQLRALVEKKQPNVLQGWMPYGNVFAYWARRWCPQAKVIWGMRGGLDDPASFRWSLRLSLLWLKRRASKVHHIVFNSERSRQQHLAYGFAPEPCKTIPNGCDTDFFYPLPESTCAQAREKWDMPPAAWVVGHVGRFHAVKDHAKLVQVFEAINQTNANAFLVCAGPGVCWENAELVKQIPAPLRSQVRLLGELSQAGLRDLYNVSDVFCLTSKSEGFPNVLAEAMACETPCVATPVGCAAEIVGDTGMVTPNRNADSLALSLLQVGSEADERGKAARQHIQACYAWPTIADQLHRLYH